MRWCARLRVGAAMGLGDTICRVVPRLGQVGQVLRSRAAHRKTRSPVPGSRASKRQHVRRAHYERADKAIKKVVDLLAAASAQQRPPPPRHKPHVFAAHRTVLREKSQDSELLKSLLSSTLTLYLTHGWTDRLKHERITRSPRRSACAITNLFLETCDRRAHARGRRSEFEADAGNPISTDFLYLS